MTAKISQHVTRRYSFPQRGSSTPTAIGATIGVTTLIVLTALGFMYLQQVLHTASQGSDVHALETQLIELKQQQRELELEGANLRSLQTVEDRIQRLNLVSTERVTYLATSPELVASALSVAALP